METGAGMKTSVYINKENEERLKALLQGDEGLSASGVINNALEDYFRKYSFDTSLLRCKKEYVPVVLRLHKVVVRLLLGLKKNFNTKAVNELVMLLLLREFQNQSGRKAFPDRAYVGLDYINKLIKTLKNKADLYKLDKIE